MYFKMHFLTWKVELRTEDGMDRRWAFYPERPYSLPPLTLLATFMCGGWRSNIGSFWFEREDQMEHFIMLTGLKGQVSDMDDIPF